MAYMRSHACIYCGASYTNIHSSKMVYSDWGAYPTPTTNGHLDGSQEALQFSYWCGQCDKTLQNPNILKLLKKMVKGK